MEINVKKILLILLMSILVISCGIKKAKPKDDLSAPLVKKNGLYYKDSTSTEPFTGRNKSKALDQVVEYDVVNGVREGDFIIYYPNKKIQMIGKISKDKNVGEWKYYYEDGNIQTTGNFNDDKPSGVWKWYYPNGKIAEEGSFIEGKRDGEWKSYDTTGTLKILRKYKLEKLIDSTAVN